MDIKIIHKIDNVTILIGLCLSNMKYNYTFRIHNMLPIDSLHPVYSKAEKEASMFLKLSLYEDKNSSNLRRI